MKQNATAALITSAAALLWVSGASATAPRASSWGSSANRICSRELAQVHAVPRPAADYLPTAQYLERTAAIAGRATTALAKLPRPATTRSALTEWISLEWQGISHIRAMAAAFRAHDLVTVRSIAAADKPRGVRADAIAAQVGAITCTKS